ncbi:MAG TPA: 2-oxo acid dehydrogenase subunit E2 [Anaerolineae bacterium]|nr:2-oxo acid dehydrogenase subunit E2 [Anaerolineae bacterium]HMR66838.1 2-oxo acid dehydrogenase subunit E2 [Anaerolineae bacterium]
MTELSPRLPVKTTLRLSKVRQQMSLSMKASVDNAVLAQVSREIDVTNLKELRRKKFDKAAPRVSFNTLIMAAVTRTLLGHPLLNAELVGDQILIYDPINLGMAVAVPDGLIVVVIRDAQHLTLTEMAIAVEDCVARCRHDQINPTDLDGSTFTVSNLGMYEIDGGFPRPRPPEGAMLLVGAARPKPAVVNGRVVPRDIAWFSLSFDHRFIDGATAAAFLKDLNELIQIPDMLLHQ